MSSSEHSTHSMYYRVQPAPPPTINRLTSRQKAKLRRSTTKLAKVLGEAPQVVDYMPSRITYVSAPRKLQPSLSITSGKGYVHRRARSPAAGRVDPDLYPLSSTLRPVSRRSSESGRNERRSRSFSRSLSSEYIVSENDREDDEKASFIVISHAPARQTRPDSIFSSTSKSRDSLYSQCDSVLDYEPTFSIPSATKMRREKMARVCKLLGEDVPVHLVFPVTRARTHFGYEDQSSDSEESTLDVVLDICSPSPPPTPQKETQLPPTPPPKLKRKPVPKPTDEDLEEAVPPVPPKQQQYQQQLQMQARWQPHPHPMPLTYRAPRPNLETIVEQSPRASCSSSASASSADTILSRCSFLTTTTSSSYRFTSSGCLTSIDCSPESSEAHETAPAPAPTPAISNSEPSSPVRASNKAASPNPPRSAEQIQIHEMSSSLSSSGTHGRREFAIYVPFRRRTTAATNNVNFSSSSSKMGSCQAEFASVNQSQECELLRGMLDLRV